MTFDEIQREMGEWQARNFPDGTDNDTFHGIVEEVGELADAIADDDEKLTKDAIGDTAIYAVNYCNHRSFSLSEILSVDDCESAISTFAHFQHAVFFDSGDEEGFLMALVIPVGHLAHARLKLKQGIRGEASEHINAEKSAIYELFSGLSDVCCSKGHDLETIILDTWKEVSARNWRANPSDGSPAGAEG